MRVERVFSEPVRCRDDNSAVGFQRPRRFAKEYFRVVDVLDDLACDDDIERSVGNRERYPVALRECRSLHGLRLFLRPSAASGAQSDVRQIDPNNKLRSRFGRVGGEPRITADDVVEQGACNRSRRARECEQRPRGLRRGQRATHLDELDKTIGGIERELHAA